MLQLGRVLATTARAATATLRPLTVSRSLATSYLRTQAEESSSGARTSREAPAPATYSDKDRTREVPLEVALKYMESAAYESTYEGKPVWQLYRRNFSNGKTKVPTRKTCIRKGVIATGNPCPICRDEYLVVDYRNLKLLNQFIDDYTGAILSSSKTNVCQKQYMKLRIELEKAKDHGYLHIDPPFVEYDYEKYMPKQ